MEIINNNPDSCAVRIKEILAMALNSAGVQREDIDTGYFLELSHKDKEIRLNISGLSEIAWTSLMFEAAAPLEEYLGGPCKLNITSGIQAADWEWTEVQGLKIGSISSTKAEGLTAIRTKVRLRGAFALKKSDVELFEYFIEVDSQNYQANLLCEGDFMKIEVGAEASSELKLSVNLGEIALSLTEAAKLRPGAILKFAKPETHSVLLSVNGAPYAIGEAKWGEGGVEIKVIGNCL